MNNYQQFLKNTLQQGLLELQQNPDAKEVAGIPRESFEILVKAFRSGLNKELAITLSHDLKNSAYIELLLTRINSLLSFETPEIANNATNIQQLVIAYNRALELRTNIAADQKRWQAIFNRQVSKYNQNLINNLQQQLEKDLPNLPEEQRERLVKDIAETIRLQALPDIKRAEDAQKFVQKVAETALKTYGSEAYDLRGNPEKISQMAKEIAQQEVILQNDSTKEDQREIIPENKERVSLWDVRSAEITATQIPGTYELQSDIQTALTASLPPEIAEDPEIITAATGEIMSRIHMAAGTTKTEYQEYIRQQTRAVLTQTKVAKLIESKGLSPAKINEVAETTASSFSEQAAPEIYKTASSPDFAQTPLAGSIAGIPFGGLTGGIPIGIPPLGGVSLSGGAVSGMMFPEGTLGDIYISSGAPLHILTAFSSPHGLEDLGKWAITGGIIRTPVSFILDSFPGMPKLDYLNVSLTFLRQTQTELSARQIDLNNKLSNASGIDQYKYTRELKEVEGRLKIVNGITNTISSNPSIKKAYEAYFGKPGRFFGLGIDNILHPVKTFQQWVINKNLLAGVGVSGATEIFFAYLKYGGYGGSYVSSEIIKQFGVFATKAIGVKLGLYEIIGVPGHRHLVFKPTHEAAVRIQKYISDTFAKSVVGQEIKDAIAALIKKLGLDALLGTLSGGTSLLLQAAWEIIKKVTKPILQAFVLLLAWLSQFSLSTALMALGGGFLTGSFFGALFGPWGFVFGFFGGTISTAIFIETLKGAFFSLGSSITSLLGNLISSLTSLTSGITTYIIPVLGITAGVVVFPTVFELANFSSAFEIPDQPSPVQSDYIYVTKSVNFSGKIGDPIKYTLGVTAKKGKLANVGITDNLEFLCQKDSPAISSLDLSGLIPKEIDGGKTVTINYEVPTNASFNDCLVTNNAQVTADVPDEQRGGERTFVSTSLPIGNPPEIPPQLPLKGNVCLSGYGYNELTRRGIIHKGIDIFSNLKTVYSPFARESQVINMCKTLSYPCDEGGYSITLVLGAYTAYMGHLAYPPTFSIGDKVPAYGEVGTMGMTGTSASGVHVHYLIQKNGVPVDPKSLGINPPACQ